MSKEKKGKKKNSAKLNGNTRSVIKQRQPDSSNLKTVYNWNKKNNNNENEISKVFEEIKDLNKNITEMNKKIETLNYFQKTIISKINHSLQIEMDKIITDAVKKEFEELNNGEKASLEQYQKELVRGIDEMIQFVCELSETDHQESEDYEELKNLIKQFKNWLNNQDFQSVKEALQRCRNGIHSKREYKNLCEALQKEKADLEETLREKENSFDDLEKKLKEKENSFDDLEKKLKEKENKINELTKITTSVSEELEETKRENQELQNRKDEVESEKSGLQEELNDMKNSLEQVEQEKEKISLELQEEKGIREDLQNEKEKLVQERLEQEKREKELEGKVESSSKELNLSYEKIKELTLNNQEWEQAIQPFMEIAKLACKCPSMAYLLEEELKFSNTTEMTKEERIVFVNRFAWDFTFARMVYESMKRHKEETLEPITEEELLFVKAINDYYKEKYGTQYAEFDALDCLSLSGGERIAFDRKKMMVLNDYRNVDILDATRLYVPALRMTNGKDIEKKAIIGGE